MFGGKYDKAFVYHTETNHFNRLDYLWAGHPYEEEQFSRSCVNYKDQAIFLFSATKPNNDHPRNQYPNQEPK